MAKSKRQHKLTRLQRRIRYAAGKALWAAAGLVAVAALVLADRHGVFGRAPQVDFQEYDGRTFRVVRVVDGDTLDLDVPDGRRDRTRVRLWGADAPETVKPNTPTQHFGPESSRLTTQMCLHRRVKINLEPGRNPRDRYGRLLAWVRLPDGRVLNDLLVKEGCAYADPRFDHSRRFELNRLQNKARRRRRGLWKEVKQRDLPYYYRGRITIPKKPSRPG